MNAFGSSSSIFTFSDFFSTGFFAFLSLLFDFEDFFDVDFFDVVFCVSLPDFLAEVALASTGAFK